MRRSGARAAASRPSGKGSAPGARRDPPAPAGERISFAPAVVAIIALWAVCFAPQLFAHRGFVLGDTADLRAFAEFSGERWRLEHVRTHWTPYLFAGLPTTASLADFRPQFLPDLLLDVWDGVHRSPFWPPLFVPLLIHLAGMLATAGLAARLWNARPAACAWAAACWGLAPNLIVPFTFGHDPQLMAVSLLPIVLLAVDGIVSRDRPAAPALGLAVAAAFMLLAQYPQIVLFAVPLAAAFATERVTTLGRRGRLAWIAGAVVLGAAMSSVSWWPAMLYNRYSVRGAAGGLGLDEVAQYSLSLRDLASLGWPWAVGYGGGTYWGGMHATDYPQYLGAASLVMALVGLRGRPPGGGKTVGLLAAATVVAMVVSIGTHLGPIYLLLHRYAPLWSSFRLPVNGLIVAQLTVALLGARGLDLAMRETRAGAPTRARRLILACGAIMLVLAGALITGPGRDAYANAARASRPAMPARVATALATRAGADLALRAGMVAALPLAFLVSAAVPGAAVPLAVVWIGADLGLLDRPHLARATGDLASLARRPEPVVARLAAADPSRRCMALRQGQFFSNDWIRWRARTISGFHPAVPLAWAELRSTGLLGRVPMMRALAIGYVSGDVRGTDDTTQYVPEPLAGDPVWRVRQARPRVATVTTVRCASTEAAALAMLAADDFDPARVAITTDARAAGAYPGGERCTVRWLTDGPDVIEWETQASGSAFVVVADAYFPGWSATLDGRPLAIHRVDRMLRGVVVPAGRHRIAMRYEPEGWTISRCVAGVAWAIAAVVAALIAWRERRATVSAPA